MEEVVLVLKEMGPTISPSVNWFHALFFQKYWHIVDFEIEEFCLNVLDKDENLEEVNLTTIVIIPKIPNPTYMAKVHPISLCKVFYKIIAKMVANCFQGVLDLCIDSA